jgi:hypothetical protein
MKRKVVVKKAAVDRPGDVGMDLPPGATATELKPTDYHPIEMEEPEGRPAKGSRAKRASARRR